MRRKEYLRETKHCEICGVCCFSLQVHHLNYDRLGKELDSDLMALCESCHRTVHRLGLGLKVRRGLLLSTALVRRDSFPVGEPLWLKWQSVCEALEA